MAIQSQIMDIVSTLQLASLCSLSTVLPRYFLPLPCVSDLDLLHLACLCLPLQGFRSWPHPHDRWHGKSSKHVLAPHSLATRPLPSFTLPSTKTAFLYIHSSSSSFQKSTKRSPQMAHGFLLSSSGIITVCRLGSMASSPEAWFDFSADFWLTCPMPSCRKAGACWLMSSPPSPLIHSSTVTNQERDKPRFTLSFIFLFCLKCESKWASILAWPFSVLGYLNPHCLHWRGSAEYKSSTAPGRAICRSFESKMNGPNRFIDTTWGSSHGLLATTGGEGLRYPIDVRLFNKSAVSTLACWFAASGEAGSGGMAGLSTLAASGGVGVCVVVEKGTLGLISVGEGVDTTGRLAGFCEGEALAIWARYCSIEAACAGGNVGNMALI